MNKVNVETNPANKESVVKRFVMLFKRQPKQEPKTPQAGEVWHIPNETPWPKGGEVKVNIIDQKDGYVRYSFGGRIFNDERMELDIFINCYEFLGT